LCKIIHLILKLLRIELKIILIIVIYHVILIYIFFNFFNNYFLFNIIILILIILNIIFIYLKIILVSKWYVRSLVWNFIDWYLSIILLLLNILNESIKCTPFILWFKNDINFFINFLCSLRRFLYLLWIWFLLIDVFWIFIIDKH